MGGADGFGFIGGLARLTGFAAFRPAVFRAEGAFFRSAFFLAAFFRTGFLFATFFRAGFLTVFLGRLRATFLDFFVFDFRDFFGMGSSFLRCRNV